jgi:hypothetical protein
MKRNLGAHKTQPINSPVRNTENGASTQNYRQSSLCAQWFQGIVTAIAAIAAVATGIYSLVILRGTLTATRTAANAASDQARTASIQAQDQHTQLELSQRAWIGVDQYVLGQIKPTTEGGDGIMIPIRLALTNYGNAVAQNVSVQLGDLPIYMGTVDQRQKDLCEPLRGGYRPHNPGFTIFPDPNRPRSYGADLVIESNTIDKARRDYERMFRMPKGTADKMGLLPIVIGCVNYTYGLANSRYHQTGFIYEVSAYDKDHPNDSLAISTSGVTSQWRLSDYNFGDAFYVD